MHSVQSFGKKAAAFWTARRISILLAVLYISGIVPLLIIAKYNFPGADDFSIGETCHRAWLESGNVFRVLQQAVLMSWHDYLHWMGYFSSIFMMSPHPGVFGEHLYQLTAWIMLGALTFPTLYLLRVLFTGVLGMDRYLGRSVAWILLIMTIQCMVGRNEMLYWYCGAVNYTFFYGIGLWYWGLLLSAGIMKKSRKRTAVVVLASVLGVFLGGGNYMTALTAAILLVSAGIVLLLLHRFQRKKILWIPAAAFFIGFGASCLAPGNANREAGVTGMGAVKAVLVSLYDFFDLCVSEWTTWPVMAGFLLMVPFLWKMARQTKFRFPFPLPVLVLCYGISAANVTPPLYAVGNIIAGRLKGLFFVQYLLMMTLALFYLVGWIQKHVERDRSRKMGEEKYFSPSVLGMMGALAAFILFGSVLCVGVDPHYYTASSALEDLRNGSAAQYGRAWEERLRILKDPAVQDAELEPLPAEPALLFFSDLTEDEQDWQNRAAARYYDKRSIMVHRKEKQ